LKIEQSKFNHFTKSGIPEMIFHKQILSGLVFLSSAVMVFGDPASPVKEEKAEEPVTVTEAEIKVASA
jgi:hypothetical protein